MRFVVYLLAARGVFTGVLLRRLDTFLGGPAPWVAGLNHLDGIGSIGGGDGDCGSGDGDPSRELSLLVEDNWSSSPVGLVVGVPGGAGHWLVLASGKSTLDTR